MCTFILDSIFWEEIKETIQFQLMDIIFQMQCITTDGLYILTIFTVSSFMVEVIC